MDPETTPPRRSLIRDVAFFQLKLLLDAARDLVLSPVSLAAALLDFVLSRHQAPRYFPAVLRLGERSEAWIDLWSAGRDAQSPERMNVDAVLSHVEAVVRDRLLKDAAEALHLGRLEPPGHGRSHRTTPQAQSFAPQSRARIRRTVAR